MYKFSALIAGIALAAPAHAKGEAPIVPLTTSGEEQILNRVSCNLLGFMPASEGTAFIAEGRMVSAAHVWRNIGRCKMKMKNTSTVSYDTRKDYAEIKLESPQQGYKASCYPMIPGVPYTAIGYRLGHRREVKLGASPYRYSAPRYPEAQGPALGTLIMYPMKPGTQVLPGMSGGPVLNPQGEVVGIIIAYEPGGALSYVRPIIDTPLCRGRMTKAVEKLSQI